MLRGVGGGLNREDELECRAESVAKKNRGVSLRGRRQGRASVKIDW